jgi:hypothetical protein
MKILEVVIAGLVATAAYAQTPVLTQKAELAVPFGVASGRLIEVGDFLVFLDDEKPDFSLAVSRSQLRSLIVSEQTLTVETVNPVRDRNGEHLKFVFRIADPSGLASVGAWYKEGPAPATAASTIASDFVVKTYQVKHDHMIGSCNGRLIIEKNRVAFESINNINHSRQWSLRDIKELKRDNPYGIKIIPFSGDTYNLSIEGKGMDSETFRELVDRVTAARLKK